MRSGICNYLNASFQCLANKNIVVFLFLGCLTVTAHELVNATRCIDELALAGVERV